MELRVLVQLPVPPVRRRAFHLRATDLALRVELEVRVGTVGDVVAVVLALLLLVPRDLETLLNLGEGVERLTGETEASGYPEVAV